MFKNNLLCHPDTRCPAVQSLQAEIEALPGISLRLRYTLCGDMQRLRIPAPQAPMSVDGLWQHSCFEAFIAVAGESAYREFNFAPSGQWAAYAFSDYRQCSPWTAGGSPSINVTRMQDSLLLEAELVASDFPANPEGKPLQIAFTAVLEANDGSLSYWALHHPATKPDFHDRAGFILTLNQT